MKYEIEIEGLPEGYEPDGKGVYVSGSVNHMISVGVRRKVRKYDWSKTLDDVLVYDDDGHIYPHACTRPRGFYTGWQPNIHGKCPVDPEASILKVRFHDKSEWEGLAQNWDWALKQLFNDIIAYQFVRLAEGYKW